jgi:hypothetical protein
MLPESDNIKARVPSGNRRQHMPGEIGDGILGRIAGGILSSARAVDLDIEVANFFAQRITVDPKKIRRTYLIAAGRG